MTVGNYEYPEKVAFADALEVAKEAITKYDGKMSNKDAAEALGYAVKNPNAISGYIFRKFDDVCSYNLMKRGRGFLESTELAEKALDPYDPRKAQKGKAEAIRKMPIVMKAFTEWNGEIPSETAFPKKLEDLTGISWQEAQKHAPSLRNLFTEVFPYLKTTPEIEPENATRGELGGKIVEREAGSMTISAKGKDFGFTKTLPFTNEGIQSLRKLIDFLETQAESQNIRETETTKTTEQEKD